MAEKDGPVYLLSLDGGGIRGIIELVILDKIMKRLQEGQNLKRLPRPCDYFHLIGGVSTGGLITIMLGRLRMTTTEAIEAYHGFAKEIFGLGNVRNPFRGGEVQGGQRMARTIFGTKKLEKIIQNMVGEVGSSEILLDEGGESLAKSFVCTQRTNNTGPRSLILLRSYKTPHKALSRDFLDQVQDTDGRGASQKTDSTGKTLEIDLQPVAWYEDCKIWEAARATSAASLCFAPVPISTNGDEPSFFVDAALGCNNPVKHMFAEAAAVFGVGRKLGCMLSLGTGQTDDGDISIGVGNIMSVAKAAFKHLTTSETTDREMKQIFANNKDTYFRISLPMGKKVKLWKHKAIKQLEEDTSKYIDEDENASKAIEQVVQILMGNHTPKINLGQVAFSDGQFKPRVSVKGRPTTSNFFVGRGDVLQKLSQLFIETTFVRQQVLIWAGAGAGKSQTVSKFLDEYENSFDGIFWVDATDEDTLIASYETIAEREGLAANSTNSTRVVLEYLAALSGKWILVLDGAQGDVRDYLPAGNHGCLLFTSRHSNIRPPVETQNIIELNSLAEHEAVTLLLREARMDEFDAENRRRAADIVQKDFDLLPLAISSAATYIQIEDINLGEYASRYAASKKQMLSRRAGQRYENQTFTLGTEAVYSSNDLSYASLRQAALGKTQDAIDHRNALRLLSAFSFYANEGLILDIFARAAERRPSDRTAEELGADNFLSLEPLLALDPKTKKWHGHACKRGLHHLHRWKLIQLSHYKGSTVISMHALTHEWARERTYGKERDIRAEAARRVLFDSYVRETEKESKDWRYNRRIMPHMRSCLEHTGTFTEKHLLLDASHKEDYAAMLLHVERPAEVLKLLDPPIKACASRDLALSHEFWRMLYTVARSCMRLGMVMKAEKIANRMLRIADAWIKLGEVQPYDLLILEARGLLAEALAEKGEWEEAATELHSIIQTALDNNGDGQWVDIWMSSLQIIYALHSQFEMACAVAKDIADRCEKNHGLEHHLTINAKRNLARAYSEVQHFAEAESVVKEVVNWEQRQEQLMSPEPTHVTIKTKTILADIHYGLDRPEASYDVYRQLLDELEANPIEALEDITASYQGCGEAALAMGRFAEGFSCGRYAFQMLFDRLGKDNPRTRQALKTLLFWIECGRDAGSEVPDSPEWDEFWVVAAEVEPWQD